MGQLTNDMFKAVSQEANKNASQFGEDLPPDSYIMDLEKCYMKKSNNGDDMVIMQFVVVEGELEGRKHWENSLISHKVGLSFLYTRMRALGYDTNAIGSVEELISYVDDINSSVYRIQSQILVRGSGENAKRSFKITGLIGQAEEVGETEQVSTTEVADAEVVSDTPDEGTEATVDVGSKVKFTVSGKTMSGEITELDEEEGKLKVKTVSGKEFEIAPDDIVGLG